jgi:nucleotide-binding universal stress UspA family protein
LIHNAIMSKNANRILVGTDFSSPAEAAVWRAGRLARAAGGELELMHVILPRDVPVYRVPGWEANRRYVVAEAVGKLRAMASEAEAKLHIPFKVHVAVGMAHAEIGARAEATGARLVVVGPHGECPVRDMFIGATAQRLRRVLRAPLLIARNCSERRYERALIAVDFSAAATETAHAAASLFPDAALHFLHVRNPLFEGRLSRAGVGAEAIQAYRNQALLEASRELDNFIRSNGLQSRRASSVVKLGHIPACIRETAAELGASIVAFGVKGKSRLESSFLGSVSEDFVSGNGYDVLLGGAMRTPSGAELPDRSRSRDTEVETAHM